MPILGSYIQSNITQGLVESAEQSFALATTGGTSNTLDANTSFWFDYGSFTNPNSYKFIKFTAVQWKNFATISGNVTGIIGIVDTSAPVSANMDIVATTPLTAHSGANSLQKVNVKWSKLLGVPTSITLAMGVQCSSATATLSLLTGQASRNERKLTALGGSIPPFDTTAWTTNTAYLADCTIFYVGYS